MRKLLITISLMIGVVLSSYGTFRIIDSTYENNICYFSEPYKNHTETQYKVELDELNREINNNMYVLNIARTSLIAVACGVIGIGIYALLKEKK